jgi:hypothetical protein
MASHPDVTYVEEPLNLRDDGPARYTFQHVAREEPEPFLGHVRRHIGAVSPRRALLKDPMALMAADWLADTFGMKVIVLIRHPAALASSLKVLGWFHPWDHFLDQPALLEGRLKAFEPEMRALHARRPNVVEDAALVWRVCHRVIRQYQAERPEWTFVRHEDLSRDPLGGFGRVFRAVGLEFTAACQASVTWHSVQAARTLDVTAAGDPYDVVRDSASNLLHWRNRLTTADLDLLRPAVDDFTHFYPEPEWAF